MKELESTIGHSFSDKSLLQVALTHSSYHNEHKECEHNERMEFLGDAVLSLIVREYLYTTYPQDREGLLSRYASTVVCESFLSEVAQKIQLQSHISLGRGCECTNAILSDVVEALIGAIYLDGGYESACVFINTYVLKEIKHIVENDLFMDSKTKLNELLQKREGNPLPEYVTKEDQDKKDMFVSIVYILGKEYGTGYGLSKREAEQEAAEQTLHMLV